MARVQLKNVEKTFNKNKVLKGINVEVPDGSFMVMVGPSGCGKSTALRCIAGLEEVTGGSIFIGDEDVTSKEPKDRNIAMVFQNYALYPHMNVFDNITYGLKVRGIPADERKRRAEDAAKLLGLDGLLDRMPKQLSGGQRQRVAMGRAIVREPSVFLFDEPLSNLDANLHLRDARSGGGHDPRRENPRAPRREHRTVRHAGRHLPASGLRIRCPVHGLPVH